MDYGDPVGEDFETEWPPALTASDETNVEC